MGLWKKLKDKRWFTYTFAGCVSVVLYVVLQNISVIANAISGFVDNFSTVIIGCVIAYLMNPLANLFSNRVFKRVKSKKINWTLSVILTIVSVIVFFSAIGLLLVPQLTESIGLFISNLDLYTAQFFDWFNSKIPQDSEELKHFALSSEGVIARAKEFIINNYSSIIDFSATAGKGMLDLIIAVMLSVYLLFAKHSLKAALVRLSAAVVPKTHFPAFYSFASRCNTILKRYIVFSIIDAVIVGLLNAIFMMIFGIQYAGLVSIIVGTANLIPTFGPFIGVVIGAFIILMINPMHALIFICFVLILQSVDAYIIRPKLFGDSLGVSPLLILIFILVGGNFAGLAGVLLAIPAAAIFGYIYEEIVLKNLEKRRKRIDDEEEEEAKLAEDKKKKFDRSKIIIKTKNE